MTDKLKLSLCFLTFTLGFPIQIYATTCKCLPEIDSSSMLEDGTCAKTQDNGYWCEMSWNGGIRSNQQLSMSSAPKSSSLNTGQATYRFLKKIEKSTDETPLRNPKLIGRAAASGDGGRPPAVFASEILKNTKPEQYSILNIKHFAIIMGSMIEQFAPDNVDIALSLYRLQGSESKQVLDALRRQKPRPIKVGKYKGRASYGCLILFKSKFEVMVKTRYSIFTGDCVDVR